MFRIKASYTGQLELKTTLERAREFFGELRNFADLMPGIEGIRKESGGIMRWAVRAEVPVIGSVRASFAVRKTEDGPERLEWSPAGTEMNDRTTGVIRPRKTAHSSHRSNQRSARSSFSELRCSQRP